MPDNRLGIIKKMNRKPKRNIENKDGKQHGKKTHTDRPHDIFIFYQIVTNFSQLETTLLRLFCLIIK